jgi:hypothetical protein
LFESLDELLDLRGVGGWNFFVIWHVRSNALILRQGRAAAKSRAHFFSFTTLCRNDTEFLSGHRVAKVSETAEWQREPWKRARYLAIRDSFVEEWQPRGGIELAMIEMMAQAFSDYLFWGEKVHERSTTDAKFLYSSEEERRVAEARGHWLPPRVSEQNAIEHAMQMMDRYNRLFLRTLRQLRDLRRYSVPITINNPRQVNIAADGGQQLNTLNRGEEES